MKKLLLLIALGLSTAAVQAQTYCSAGPSSTYDSEITGVELHGDNDTINRYSTACGTSGVQDFTATDSADIELGTQYSIDVVMGTCGGNYSGAISAWIDYNADGDFTDAGEQLGTHSGTPTDTVTWTFTVPGSATLGTTRLRVMQQEGGSTTGIAPCNTFSWGAVEDYTINITGTPPSCPNISGVSATPSTYSATVNWTADTAHQYYVIEYDTAGFTAGSGDTVWSYIDSVVITGLNANTAYDFNIVGYCSSTSQSFASTGSFTTLCAPYATTYTEDFDGVSAGSSSNPSLPSCWDYYQAVSSSWSNYIYTYSWLNYTSPNSLRFYESSSSSYTGDSSFAIMPEIVGLDSATKQLKFYGRKGSNSYPGRLIVAVTDAQGSTASMRILDTLYMVDDQWAEYTFYLDSAAGIQSGDARIALGKICGGVYDYMYIDDVEVSDIPLCPPPTSGAQTTQSPYTAGLSWTSGASSFFLEYGLTGFVQGTGNLDTVSTNSALLTGLAPNTSYDVYVQADCSADGNGMSTKFGPITVTTSCVAANLPIYHGFENDSVGGWSNHNAPNCWSLVKETGTSGYGYVYTSSWTPAYAGNNMYYLYNSSSTTLKVGLATPELIGLDSANKQIRLYARASSTWSTTTLAVGTMSDPTDASTFNTVDTITLTGSFVEYTIPLDTANGYNGTDDYIALVHGNASSYTGIYMDEINIEEIPSCPPADSVTITQIGLDSALVTWVQSGSNSTLEYGPTGFVQGTGTQVSATSSPFWLTGLDSLTTYDLYIIDTCTNGSASPAAGPYTFSTLACSPANACAFELELTDSYGDGWNGALLDMVDQGSGAIIATYGADFTTGSSYTYNISICQGLTVDFVVNSAGSYPSEIGMNLTQGGSSVASYANTFGTTTGTIMGTATANCNTACPAPDSLATGYISTTTADFTYYQQTAGSYHVYEYGLQGFTQGTGMGTIDSTTASSFTLSGLTKGNCYDVYLWASCGANGASSVVGPLTFCTPQCDTADQCVYTINMYDSYGDGWNGGSVGVYQDTNLIAQLGSGFTSGSSATETLIVCNTGQNLTITNFNQGSWPSEISFDIVLAGDTTKLVNATSFGSTGDTLGSIAPCKPVSCPAPTSVAMSGITATAATASWAGATTSTGFEYEFGPTGGTMTSMSTTAMTAALTSLTPATNYTFQVREICTAGDTSLWSYVTFTTDTCPDIAGSVTVGQVDTTLTSADFEFDFSTYANWTSWTIDYGDGSTAGSGSSATDTHTYTANGQYTVTITLSSDCDTETITLYVDIMGIGMDELAVSSLRAYPNPTAGVLNIEFNSEASEANVQVFSTVGSVVAETTIYGNNGDFNHKLDLSNVAAGTYTVRITTERGTMVVPFIINR